MTALETLQHYRWKMERKKQKQKLKHKQNENDPSKFVKQYNV